MPGYTLILSDRNMECQGKVGGNILGTWWEPWHGYVPDNFLLSTMIPIIKNKLDDQSSVNNELNYFINETLEL